LTSRVPVAICIPLVSAFRITPGEVGYPARLAALPRPRTLYGRGPLPDAAPAVAIVGARAASRAAMDTAHAIARAVAERGVVVVSGGALGVDGAAHAGALAGGGKTTVVLGSGIDILYPERHADLFAHVLAAGGTLLSQLPPGTSPLRTTFVQRNPVIAALADLVIVVEAQLRSGSLSTARAARELGRTLAAVPGSPGTDRLIATGAARVITPADALALLGGNAQASATPSADAVLDPIALQIAAATAAGANGVDAIVAATGLSARAVVRALATANQPSSARLS